MTNKMITIHSTQNVPGEVLTRKLFKITLTESSSEIHNLMINLKHLNYNKYKKSFIFI